MKNSNHRWYKTIKYKTIFLEFPDCFRNIEINFCAQTSCLKLSTTIIMKHHYLKALPKNNMLEKPPTAISYPRKTKSTYYIRQQNVRG